LNEEISMTGVVVVTGAGSGIGKAAALALIAAGHTVVLAGRRPAALEAVASQASAPTRAVVMACDVTVEAQVDALFDTVAQRFGRIDTLFNNAGLFTPSAPFDELSLAAWQQAVDTNLTGSFLCARAAFRHMKRQDPQGGRIINNGSISAHVPRPQAAAYTATKHAITGLTRAIALDGRAYNIACGQIDIGNAATEITHGFGAGALQADGTRKPEAMMDVQHAASAVVYMASLPLAANIPFMTVMATGMPYIGRG
jgi:NAD(P)-dependent dehydrogenase (short-subunit alcohol dehydrogenase family)